MKIICLLAFVICGAIATQCGTAKKLSDAELSQVKDLVISLQGRRMYDQVIEKTTEVLKNGIHDERLLSMFLYYRAVANLQKASSVENKKKRSFYRDAAADCMEAMQNSWAKTKCLPIRGSGFMGMGNIKRAIADYEKYLKTEKSDDVTKKLKEAKEALEPKEAKEPPPRKPKSDDYYDVLDISSNATPVMIKKAYHKKALEHHPDRHSKSSKKLQNEHAELFKAVGEAYEVLKDPAKRKEYDRERQAKK